MCVGVCVGWDVHMGHGYIMSPSGVQCGGGRRGGLLHDIMSAWNLQEQVSMLEMYMGGRMVGLRDWIRCWCLARECGCDCIHGVEGARWEREEQAANVVTWR